MADAILKPSNSRQVSEYCRLIARKGGGMVLLQLVDPRTDEAKGNPFSADRMRLRQVADRDAAVPDAVIDALPWQGKGADPRLAVDLSGPAAERAFLS